LNDIKKARQDAAVQVTQVYDEEQDIQDMLEMEQNAVVSAAGRSDFTVGAHPSPLENYLRDLPILQNQLAIVDRSDVGVVLDVVHCLHALRAPLNLSASLNPEDFVREILGNTALIRERDVGSDDGPETIDTLTIRESLAEEKAEDVLVEAGERDGSAGAMELEAGGAVVDHGPERSDTLNAITDGLASTESDADRSPALLPNLSAENSIVDPQGKGRGGEEQEDAGDENEAEGQDEAELDEDLHGAPDTNHSDLPGKTKASGVYSIQSSQNEVELDRVQLNIIRVLLSDLHALLGLTDKEDRKGVKLTLALPLNQLTWHEIARMIILVSINREILKTDDEVFFYFTSNYCI
jgi:hypothetical protein